MAKLRFFIIAICSLIGILGKAQSIPASAINAWEVLYSTDEFGDRDLSKPPYIGIGIRPATEPSVYFYILACKGILICFPALDDIMPMYDGMELIVKSNLLGRNEIPIKQLSQNTIVIEGLENNHLMMSYLVSGNFKIALKLTYSFAPGDDRIITTSIGHETIGAWEAAQKHLQTAPCFWDVWGGDMYP